MYNNTSTNFEKSWSKIIPYVLICIYNPDEMLNYSQKITLVRQKIFQHKQGLPVKAATWTFNVSLYIPFKSNLGLLLDITHKFQFCI